MSRVMFPDVEDTILIGVHDSTTDNVLRLAVNTTLESNNQLTDIEDKPDISLVCRH
jgi:hypothetical protein